jgi:hypothetical protein
VEFIVIPDLYIERERKRERGVYSVAESITNIYDYHYQQMKYQLNNILSKAEHYEVLTRDFSAGRWSGHDWGIG